MVWYGLCIVFGEWKWQSRMEVHKDNEKVTFDDEREKEKAKQSKRRQLPDDMKVG